MRTNPFLSTTLAGGLALCFAGIADTAIAQINKHLVEAAPKEEPAQMPHIDPAEPDRPKVTGDKSTNIWRSERDAARNPQRTAGPIDIQRYEIQLEPVGIKTFFHLPIAMSQEDLIAGEVDVAIFGAPTGALPALGWQHVGASRGPLHP